MILLIIIQVRNLVNRMSNIVLNEDEYNLISNLILNYINEIRSYNARDRFAEDLSRYLHRCFEEAINLGNLIMLGL
jgi:hypothetical protein